MKVLIVKIGYIYYAVTSDYAAEVIAALSEVRVVKQEGYGKEKQYILDDNGEEFEFTMIDESRIVIKKSDETEG